MKHALLLLALTFSFSCDKEVNCNSGSGPGSAISGEGTVVHHPGFNQLVIRFHVPGTIDSYNTYLPCNLPDSLAVEGKYLQFEGSSQKLEEQKKPLTQIAGETFFVLFISSIKTTP